MIKEIFLINADVVVAYVNVEGEPCGILNFQSFCLLDNYIIDSCASSLWEIGARDVHLNGTVIAPSKLESITHSEILP